MTKKIISILFAIILGCISISIFAETIYKDKDSQGNVTYSDIRPSDDAEEINIKIDKPLFKTNAQPLQEELKPEAPVPSPPELTPEQKEEIKKTCDNYRSNLATLNMKGRRIYTVNEKGEYHYYNDKERADEIKKLEDNIKQYCK